MSLTERIASILEAHEENFTYDGKQTGCSCGHWQDRGRSVEADHAAHQAKQVVDLLSGLRAYRNLQGEGSIHDALWGLKVPLGGAGGYVTLDANASQAIAAALCGAQ